MPKRSPYRAILVHLPPEHIAALDRLVVQRRRTSAFAWTRNACIRQAIESFLRALQALPDDAPPVTHPRRRRRHSRQEE